MSVHKRLFISLHFIICSCCQFWTSVSHYLKQWQRYPLSSTHLAPLFFLFMKSISPAQTFNFSQGLAHGIVFKINVKFWRSYGIWHCDSHKKGNGIYDFRKTNVFSLYVFFFFQGLILEFIDFTVWCDALNLNKK